MPQDSKYLLVKYSSVVLRNLRVLNYDFDTLHVPKQPDSFLSFFKVSRKAEFIHILHFLFRTLNPAKYNEELSGLLGPKSDIGFKNATYRWLRVLSAEFPKVISNFFATWSCPAGIGVMRLLANLSSYVLVVSNDIIPFVKQSLGNSLDCERVQSNSMKNAQLNLEYLFSRIYSEELLQRELQKGYEALDVEVQHASKELFKFKKLIVSDSDFQTDINNAKLFSLCSDETIGLSDELIAYQMQLKKEVSTLRQQLETYLIKHKPSLLLLDNILDNLNDQKSLTLNGSNMKFLQSGTIFPSYLDENNKEEEPKQTDDKLNFHLFLRHSTVFLQTALKSYKPCFINDKFEELVSANSKSSSQTNLSDCLNVFKQTVDQFYTQTSPINSTCSTNSKEEFCCLMNKMHNTIDELQLELKDEWIRESQKNLDIPEFSATYSVVSKPCICQTSNEYDVNNMSNNKFDTLAVPTLNKPDKIALTTPSSHESPQNVCISYQLFEKSPACSNSQSNFLDKTTNKLSRLSLESNSVNEVSKVKRVNNVNLDYTTSSSLSTFFWTNSNSCDVPLANNTLQNLSINPSKNILVTDKVYTDFTKYQLLPSSSSSSTSENIANQTDILKDRERDNSFKDISKLSLSLQKSPSIQSSLKDLSNIGGTSVPLPFQSFSSTMELKESLSCTPKNNSFNLIDNDLDFINDLLPSSPT
ncbi:unnamed protein product [Schistosoma turkestanicum]|nr:unnamed protein product [Schistosoma turkestanicum]